MPKGKKILASLGENIKLARLRRKLATEQVAERAGISRATLWQIEKGTPSVAMGAYFQVLFVLGMEKDFLKLAGDDELGRKLQDAGLITKERAPKRNVNKKMATTNKSIYVFAGWVGLKEPTLMGILTTTHVRGKEVFSFQYTDTWLASGHTQNLDPNLGLYSGAQFNQLDKPNFGIFLDSSPDRWGRVLMKRREAIIARKEGRKLNILFESDFLLGVYDEHRMGGLRFKTDPDGDFLSAEKELASPPWASLRDLEYASLQLEKEDYDEDDGALKWLNMLIVPGSSLGGARPKASIKDTEGNLWIAKFPSRNDEHNVGAWEMVAFQIASEAGIKVSPSMVRQFSGRHHTFLNQRFDRNAKGERIHFASAMTLLGYNDGADYKDGISYIELAEFLVQNGSNVNEDLKELWRRIILNICISNTDDHLRNHGFLLNQQGWSLSPVYDVNPIPQGTGLTLNISEDDNSLDVELALSVIPYFRIKQQEAKTIIEQVKSATSNWRQIAESIGIPRREQEIMEGAFGQFK
ncbi:MAG: HipA domain-containing protein [Segetibacter sp.]